ncbi:hypothetical protein ABZ818_40080, partial [Streptomyces sp. NPDC047453]
PRLNLLDRQPISTQSHQRQTPLIVTPDAVAVLTRIAIDQGLRWSIWRRPHQAEARRHHFRRRLRLQMIKI